ncbi:MAG: hypothetical protein ACRYGF_11590 [Janthinobacterium lividum]
MQHVSRGSGRDSVDFMAGSAVWLTCCDCGHTTRVLAVLASRVIKARPYCPDCASTAAPLLNATTTGTGIALSEEQRIALRETDDPAVHAWLQRDRQPAPVMEWVRAAQNEVVSRFSRSRRPGSAQAHHLDSHDRHKSAGTISDGSLPAHS